MIVSNSKLTADYVVVPASENQAISNIYDGDFSSLYSVSAATVTITATPTEQSSADFIALSGNFSTKDSIVITNGGLEIVNETNLGFFEASVLVYDLRSFGVAFDPSADVVITVNGGGTLIISDIAFGSAYEIPFGEQAGYKRPWSIPNRTQRTATALNNSPIATLYESRALRSTIVVPNNIMDSYGDWYAFLDFATRNTFFINEDGNPFHSCAGFNALPAQTAAHSQTRELGVSSITFDAFAKESDIYL